MKRFALAALFAFLSTAAHADIGTIVTFPGGTNEAVQVNKKGTFAGDSNFTYSSSTHRLTVSSITAQGIRIPGLIPGRCMEVGASGELSSAIDACGSGGSGGAGVGIIVAAPQFSVGYYGGAGSTTTVTGDSGITTDGLGNLSVLGLQGSTIRAVTSLASPVTNTLLAADSFGVLVATGNPARNVTDATTSGTAVSVTETGLNNVTGVNVALGGSGGGNPKGFSVTDTGSQNGTHTGVWSVTNPTNGTAIGALLSADGVFTSYGAQVQAIGTGDNIGLQVTATGGTTNTAFKVIAGSSTILAPEGLKVTYGVVVGSLTCTGSPCGSVGGGTSGTVNVGTQFTTPYYAGVSTNVVSAATNFQNNGTTITATGPFFGADVTAQTVAVSSASQNIPAYLNTFGKVSARAVRLNTTDVVGTLPQIYGGTGNTLYSDGQILIGNSTTGGQDLGTLTAGTNVTISSGNGSITINASGGSTSLPLPAGATNYIQNSATLQTGTMVYVTSVTVSGPLTSTGNTSIGGANQTFIPALGNGTATLDGRQLRFVAVSTTIAGNPLSALNIIASDIPTILSTMTFTGNVNVSSGLLLSGSAGTNGQVVTSGGPGTVPTFTTLSGAALASTQTFTGSDSFTSTVAFRGGLYLSHPTMITATYTAVSTDTVILGNAAVLTPVTVNLPSAASSAGQILTISKVDTTTGSYVITAAGTDVIAGTGTITLNAFGQTDTIMSDGVSHWIPWGQGIQITPSFLAFGPGFAGTAQTGVSVSSDTALCPTFAAVPVSIVGFRTNVVATGSGVYAFGIYDYAGNLVASTGPVTIAGTAMQTTLLATPVNLPAGQYMMGVLINNTTTTLGGLAGGSNYPFCARKSGTTSNLPATIYPTTAASSKLLTIQAMTAGGKTSE